jgi:hypothetical protein
MTEWWLVKTWEQELVALFKALFQDLRGETDEIHDKPPSG